MVLTSIEGILSDKIINLKNSPKNTYKMITFIKKVKQSTTHQKRFVENAF